MAGLCYRCGDTRPEGYMSCQSCRSKLTKARARDKTYMKVYGKEHRLNIKRCVFKAYGAKCVCCGETNLSFLTIDHINNDGGKQRKVIGSGLTVYMWIIKNGFPPDLRVLCYNCNMGRAINGGICPHKTAPVSIDSTSPKLLALRAKEKSLQSSFVQPAENSGQMN
jgi:hypothetical protein